MNTISITAGEMMGINNDLYQICKRFREDTLNKSHNIKDLQKSFKIVLIDYLEQRIDDTDNKPFITTVRINYLIDKVCFNDFLTYEEFTAYVELLMDELKFQLKMLSEIYSFIFLDDDLTTDSKGYSQKFIESNLYGHLRKTFEKTIIL